MDNRFFYDGINNEILEKNPKIFKLPDIVTYDDGNIIPLSERFRTDREGDEAWKNNDLRYSFARRDTGKRRKSASEIVDAVVEFSEAYGTENDVFTISKTAKKKLRASLSDEYANQVREEIAREILERASKIDTTSTDLQKGFDFFFHSAEKTANERKRKSRPKAGISVFTVNSDEKPLRSPLLRQT